MTKTLQGVIHGRTIELLDDPGMPEGETVEIVVCSTNTLTKRGDGFLRAAGALADSWSAEDDAILAHLEQDRSRSISRELPQ